MERNDQFFVKDKDPNYVYRWCNSDDRAMRSHQADGYETVLDPTPENATTEIPKDGAGVTRRRGQDLVLCRIPRERFNETVGARRAELAAHHRGAQDNSLEQINDHMRNELQKRGGKNIPRQLVFRSTDNPDLSQHIGH